MAGAIALAASALWAGPVAAMPVDGIGGGAGVQDGAQSVGAEPVYWRRGFGWRRPGWGWRYGVGYGPGWRRPVYGWRPYGFRPYGWRRPFYRW